MDLITLLLSSSSLDIHLFAQVFVLDEVVRVALAAVVHNKDLGIVHVVDAGVIQSLRLRLWDNLRWTAVVALPQSELPHQDFGQEHVANFTLPEFG